MQASLKDVLCLFLHKILCNKTNRHKKYWSLMALIPYLALNLSNTNFHTLHHIQITTTKMFQPLLFLKFLNYYDNIYRRKNHFTHNNGKSIISEIMLIRERLLFSFHQNRVEENKYIFDFHFVVF